ncbi:MAG: hypothetical protein WD794_13495 [Mycobacteriales bacterium]
MSKLVRASAVLAAAGLAVPLWAAPAASAATTTEPASAGGYFSAAGLPDTGTPAGKPPNVTAEADGVAPGNLAVAGGNGAEQKVSFLYFSLDALEPGAALTRAELTVPLVPADGDNVVVAADPAKVRACPAGPQGFGGEDGESITVAPERLCDQAQAPAELSADGASYVFDLTAIAALWATANDGVALTVAEGAESAAFQIVFASADQATLTYDTPAQEGDLLDPVVPGPATTSEVGPVDAGSADLGGGGFSLDDGGGFGSADAPVVDADVPVTAGQEPAAAGPQTAAAPTFPVAAISEPMRPTAVFWLGALLFGATLALLSLIMGDPRLPQAAARQSRLSSALQARERGTGRRAGLGMRPAAT